MGIIRKILVLFLLLSVFVLSGQTTTDTILFDGDIYVKHIVNAGESLKSIANLHKVKTADIIDNNDLPRDYFKEDFFELIGDILVDIITNEEPVVDNN